MLTALVNGNRVRAWPGGRARCPGCAAEVLAKCGEIKIEHWAHVSGADCDPWFEPESAWHLHWKGLFPSLQVEVVRGGHRADVVLADGTVIELQHSSLSPAEVREREAFYGRMIWIIDASAFAGNVDIRPRDGYLSFRWKWPRLWMASISRRLIWDFGSPYETPYEPWLGPYYERIKVTGERFLEIKKLYNAAPCGGWGDWLDPDDMSDLLGEPIRELPEPAAIGGQRVTEGACR